MALTGSDTSSNVLFGSLQRITAEQLGLSPTLMAAANSSGGVMGKMVDAQSIVVASTATRWYGHEGEILRYVFFHSLALACLVGLLVTAAGLRLPVHGDGGALSQSSAGSSPSSASDQRGHSARKRVCTRSAGKPRRSRKAQSFRSRCRGSSASRDFQNRRAQAVEDIRLRHFGEGFAETGLGDAGLHALFP